MRSKRLMSLVVTVAIAVSTGCGGGSSSVVTPAAVTVSVSPTTANLRPGQTQQFTATVTSSSNTAVTWSVSAGNGSINSAGMYTAPVTPSSQTNVTVTATPQADSTKSANATVTVVALSALTMKPRGPAIALSGNQQLTVVGTFSDGTKYDWTNESTWSSADTTVATVAGKPGLTGGASLGVTTITASYGSVTTSTAVNVTNMTMTNANLSGHYAFSLSHAGKRGQGFEVGSFFADGSSNITAGREDTNSLLASTPSGGLQIMPGTGCNTPNSAGSCYTVNFDGRGTLTLTTAQGSRTFAFILSNDGIPSSKGKFILSGSDGVEVGTFEAQKIPASLSGNYALLLGGMDGIPQSQGSTFQNPIALAGQFSASGNNLTGNLDTNDNGVVNANTGSSQPFSATVTASPDANGRGTLQVIPSSSLGFPGPWSFAYYVVDNAKVLLMQTDVQAGTSTTTVPALAGTAELQTFATTNIGGNPYVFLLERSASPGLLEAAGQWTFGAGTVLSGEMDINKLGITTNVAISNSGPTASYGIVSPSNGRGTVTIPSGATTPAAPSLNSAVFYLISSTRMYILETDVKPNAGVGEQQDPAFSLLTGTLAFNLGQLATNGFDSSFSGQLVTGLGAGIADSNIATNCQPASSNCVVSQASSVLTGAAFNSPDLYGRGTAALDLPSQTNPNYGFYLVSPKKMVVFGLQSPQAGYQAVDGVIEIQ